MIQAFRDFASKKLRANDGGISWEKMVKYDLDLRVARCAFLYSSQKGKPMRGCCSFLSLIALPLLITIGLGMSGDGVMADNQDVETLPSEWDMETNQPPLAENLWKWPTAEAATIPSPPAQLELERQILAKFKEEDKQPCLALCRTFLQSYPQAPSRNIVVQIFQSILQKNIVLYPLGSQFIQPGEHSSVLLIGHNLENVAVSLWKVNLSEALSQGFSSYVAAFPNPASAPQTWSETIAVQPGYCSRTIALPPLASGCYMIMAKEKDLDTKALILVTNLSLLVKRDANMCLVWAARRDGLPLTRPVELKLLQQRQFLCQTHTNKDGIWAAKIPKNSACGQELPLTFLASCNEDMAIVDSNWYQYEREYDRCYIITDRPVYFPGQVIHSEVILRRWQPVEHKYGYETEAKVTFTVQDQEWKTLFQKELQSNNLGTASVSYTLPVSAKAGKYTLRLRGQYLGERYFTVMDLPQTGVEQQETKAAEETPAEKLQISEEQKILRVKSPQRLYRIGDKMSIPISLAKSQPLFVTYEQDHLIGYSLLVSPASEVCCEKVLTAMYSPYVRICATTAAREAFVAETVRVLNPEDFLKIDVERQMQEAVAQEPYTFHVSVQNNQGQSVAAELLFFAVPESFWQETYRQYTNIEEFYYTKSRIGQVPMSDSFQFEFPHEGEYPVLATSSSQEGVAKVPSKQRPDITRVSYLEQPSSWQPHLRVDGKQKSEVVWEKPSVGQWRIMMIAIDDQTRVGQTHFVVRCLSAK